MIQYLSQEVLSLIYGELNRRRLAILGHINKGGDYELLLSKYCELGNMIDKVDKQYKLLTGEELWTITDL